VSDYDLAVIGAARFLDAHTVSVDGTDTRLRARHFLACTRASPATLAIAGLQDVLYWNYQSVWEQLARRLLVIGSGPVEWS
jgi:pyruvate/2-oxoglutarate dehydrogenase complex dihydrolipoamide dehydrogenase (E3) component